MTTARHQACAALLAAAPLLLTACQTEEAWEVIEEISVTWASDSDAGTDTVIGSGTNGTTTSETTDMTGPTSTMGPGGTNSATETGTTTGPTTGAPGVCGNGEVEGDEECDDGNDDNTDECLNSCQLPYCGDGIDGEDEECDDGNKNDDDGCNSVCARDRVVFVTSTKYSGDLSGINGATNACRTRASAAGLPNANTYLAWISDANASPETTFLQSKGRYILPTDMPVAMDWTGLTSGTLLNPIDTDESGMPLGGVAVWTNTLATGSVHSDPLDCGGWMSKDPKGRWGVSTMTDSNWTDADALPELCGTEIHLYCFEQ